MSTSFLRFVEQEKLTVVNLPTPYWHEWVSELSVSKAPLPAALPALPEDAAAVEGADG